MFGKRTSVERLAAYAPARRETLAQYTEPGRLPHLGPVPTSHHYERSDRWVPSAQLRRDDHRHLSRPQRRLCS